MLWREERSRVFWRGWFRRRGGSFFFPLFYSVSSTHCRFSPSLLLGSLFFCSGQTTHNLSLSSVGSWLCPESVLVDRESTGCRKLTPLPVLVCLSFGFAEYWCENILNAFSSCALVLWTIPQVRFWLEFELPPCAFLCLGSPSQHTRMAATFCPHGGIGFQLLFGSTWTEFRFCTNNNMLSLFVCRLDGI